MKPKILVVGSSNTDMVVTCPRFPLPGETVLGGNFLMNQGGKGANQAVAAARLGGEVTFVCKVGDDVFGNTSLQAYENEEIMTEYVFFDKNKSSGVALITVDEKGENSIVVSPGANSALSAADIGKAFPAISETDIILMQLEIPVETVVYVAEIAEQYGKKVILNPAPAKKLSKDLLSKVFILTPNQSETEFLTGVKVTNQADAKKAAAIFHKQGVHTAIITMGSEGAYISSPDVQQFIKTIKVPAIDTTAAGDVFHGGLAVGLAEGNDIAEAVEFAMKAASISVTRLGAQSSAPFREEIKRMG